MPKRQLTDADRVWNRACGFDEQGNYVRPENRDPTRLREGDLALAALFLVDGYIQNGGVSHAFDLPPDKLAAGIAGYHYFGLGELADAIKPHDGNKEAEYNDRYCRFTAPVDQIRLKFKEMFRDHQERFAPL